jgi:hypothetical protein
MIGPPLVRIGGGLPQIYGVLFENAPHHGNQFFGCLKG